MTADEAASVIARWQQERVDQTGLTDRPAVPDVAEGLDIPIEEVQRLLAEVRAQRLEEERALAQEQKLSEAKRQLVEEVKLADIQQEQVKPPKRSRSRHQWVETKPGVWEDVNEPAVPPLVSLGIKIGAVVFCLLLSTAITLFVCLVLMVILQR